MTIYILLVITKVYGGAHATMQEFNSKSDCEYAKTIILQEFDKMWANGTAYCVVK